LQQLLATNLITNNLVRRVYCIGIFFAYITNLLLVFLRSVIKDGKDYCDFRD